MYSNVSDIDKEYVSSQFQILLKKKNRENGLKKENREKELEEEEQQQQLQEFEYVQFSAT